MFFLVFIVFIEYNMLIVDIIGILAQRRQK